MPPIAHSRLQTRVRWRAALALTGLLHGLGFASMAYATDVPNPCIGQSKARLVWPSEMSNVHRDAVLVIGEDVEGFCSGYISLTTAADVSRVPLKSEIVAAAGETSFIEMRPDARLEAGTDYVFSNHDAGLSVSFTTTSTSTQVITQTSTLAPPLIYFHPSEGRQATRTLQVQTTLAVADAPNTGAVYYYRTNADDDPGARVLLDLTGHKGGDAQLSFTRRLEFAEEICIAAIPHDQTGRPAPATHACASALPNADVLIISNDEAAGGCRAIGQTPIESAWLVLIVALLGRLRRRRELA